MIVTQIWLRHTQKLCYLSFSWVYRLVYDDVSSRGGGGGSSSCCSCYCCNIIIINKVLIKVTLNKVIAGALYVVICG